MFILMNIWIIEENSVKHHQLKKEDFYSPLNLEDVDVHAKRVCKDFETKNLRECYDLYVQTDTLLLADIFQNFRNMCLKIYELDPAKCLSASGLA